MIEMASFTVGIVDCNKKTHPLSIAVILTKPLNLFKKVKLKIMK
jgi:hypothetical protein